MSVPTQATPGTVKDVMMFGRPVSELGSPMAVMLDAEDSIEEALNFMLLKQMGCILATTGEELVGILTERDILLKVVSERTDMSTIKISGIMTPNPESFRETDPIAAVIMKMQAGGYRHAPIVDAANHPIGIISVKDIIQFVANNIS